MARGNDGALTYRDEKDHMAFLKRLRAVKKLQPFRLFAYCLMPNHFHLLVEVGRYPLSSIMQQLLTAYCKYYNFRHERTGHVFQSRFKAILCDRHAYLLELLRYIHLNPVRAGIIERPEQWPYSGHRELLAKRSDSLVDRRFLLSLFHPQEDAALRLYLEFISAGAGGGRRPDYYPSSGRLMPADEARPVPSGEDQQSMPDLHDELLPRMSAQELGQEFARNAGISTSILTCVGRKRRLAALKRSFAKLALGRGIRACEIAAYLHCSSAAISQWLDKETAEETRSIT